MISEATKRTVFRTIHLVFSIPIIGYIYSPFKEIPNYAPAVRFVFFPLLPFPDCRCGRAISCDDCFQKIQRAPAVRVVVAPTCRRFSALAR